MAAIKGRDAHDWGYDPLHYTVPEGSYATDPDGWTRVREFRGMIAALTTWPTIPASSRPRSATWREPELGTAFVLAGSDRLRSKSLDRNSYNSGDWFNRLLWDCKDGNGFGAGLPPAPDNQAYWIYDRPLLADPALRPDCAVISAARNQFREFLRIRRSSLAFSVGSATEIQRRVSFPAAGAAETPGVISMRIDTTGLDPHRTAVIVIFNASPQAHVQPIDPPTGAQVALHPVQAASLDPIVKRSAFDATHGTLTVPARTVAVFTQS